MGGQRFTVTMRTPGHDEELAAGFLFGEGFVSSSEEIGEIRKVVGKRGEPEPNIIDVILKVGSDRLRERLKRNFVVSSSCGICGKTSIESIQRRIAPIVAAPHVSAALILKLPAMMGEAQAAFAETGGIHACALFALADGGAPGVELVILREDVGRHNAVDKVVGYALMHRMVPLSASIMMVSGRLSFEIVQKAASAGIPILAAVSAPSSLAVALADEVGVTTVGFVRDRTFNLYTHPERLA